MSRKIKLLMAESQKGSISALSELSNAIGSNVGLLVQAFPIIFQHLCIVDIPQEPFPWADSVKNAHSGRLTIMCLQILQTKIRPGWQSRRLNESLDPTIRSGILMYLDRLWPAPKFLLERLERETSSSSAEFVFQQNMHAIIVEIIYVLTNDHATRPIVLSQLGILSVIAQIWMLEVEVVDSNKSASTILISSLMNHPEDIPFPQGMCGLEQKFASFMLDQLHTQLRAKQPQLALINSIIILIHAWSSHENDPYEVFIQARSIPSICNLLRQMSSSTAFRRRINISDADLIPMVFQGALGYLYFCIQMTGPWAALEAIDHRLVLSLVRCREIFQKEDHSELLMVYAKLFRGIQSCLVYPKILRRAGKSIRAIRQRQLDTTYPSEPELPSSVFQDLWASFVSSFERLLAVITLLITKLAFLAIVSVFAPGATGHTIALGLAKRLIGRQPKVSESKMRPSDYAFLSDMMMHDLQQVIDNGLLDSTADLYYLEHSDLDPRTFIGLFDYFGGKHSFSVISQAAFREAEGFDAEDNDSERIAGMNQILADARRGLGFLVAFKIRIPSSMPWIPMRILE
ncbi:hypothetical protein C8J56DRAFT_1075536 [Mycena floridula]|nr:hypothetical protein C8J56DRAFT_1075536 [Mycena floridula]